MAKKFKNIRIKIPADLHAQIKSYAVMNDKTLAQRIVEILKSGAAFKP